MQSRAILPRIAGRTVINGRGPGAAVAANPPGGPTPSIVQVLRAAPTRQLTVLQVIAELDRLYPGKDHRYAHQVLSRSANKGGPFDRQFKDPATGNYLYFLRAAPPDGVSYPDGDANLNREESV